MKTEDVDRFFSMIEDLDAEFVGNNEHPDVPVLTYRWCRNDLVGDCTVEQLVDIGQQSMLSIGLQRVVRHEHHLRGDTSTGQRVKMTVLMSGTRCMYVLMIAGMPGTREMSKGINAQLAKLIEESASNLKDKQ